MKIVEMTTETTLESGFYSNRNAEFLQTISSNEGVVLLTNMTDNDVPLMSHYHYSMIPATGVDLKSKIYPNFPISCSSYNIYNMDTTQVRYVVVADNNTRSSCYKNSKISCLDGVESTKSVPGGKTLRGRKANSDLQAIEEGEGEEEEDEALCYKRLVANGQERRRMHRLNCALEELRKVLPESFHGYTRRLSKIKTLRIAIAYIGALKALLSQQSNDEDSKMLIDVDVDRCNKGRTDPLNECRCTESKPNQTGCLKCSNIISFDRDNCTVIFKNLNLSDLRYDRNKFKNNKCSNYGYNKKYRIRLLQRNNTKTRDRSTRESNTLLTQESKFTDQTVINTSNTGICKRRKLCYSNVIQDSTKNSVTCNG